MRTPPSARLHNSRHLRRPRHDDPHPRPTHLAFKTASLPHHLHVRRLPLSPPPRRRRRDGRRRILKGEGHRDRDHHHGDGDNIPAGLDGRLRHAHGVRVVPWIVHTPG